MQCAERKEKRPLLLKLEKLKATVKHLRKECSKLKGVVQANQLRAMAAEAKLGGVVAHNSECDTLTDEHKQWVRALHADGQSVNFIAGKMDLDLVTTAMIIEGLA